MVDEQVVGFQVNLAGKITGFLRASDRVDEYSVAMLLLQGRELKVFVSPVWDVSRVKPHHSFPMAVLEYLPRLGWRQFIRLPLIQGFSQQLNLAG